MSGYYTDIAQKTVDNEYFCRVLFTGPLCQLVVMALPPGEDIGLETHMATDQFIRVERGEGKALLDGQEYALKDGAALVIPAGTEHNIINASATQTMKLYTIYTPPEHPDGTIHMTKADAEIYENTRHA